MKGFIHPSVQQAAMRLGAWLGAWLSMGLFALCGLSHAGHAAAATADVVVPAVALVRAEGKAGALDVIPVPAEQIEAQVLDLTRQLAQRVARQGAGATIAAAARSVSRLEVSLGAANARLRLAPCAKVQTYVPDGSSLWGRSRVGVRCEQGEVRWNVFVPVIVRVFGQGVVPAVNLTVGSRIEAADLRVAEVDLAAEGSPAILNIDEAIGRLAAHNVQAGQSLRHGHLKPRRYFAVGDPVRLIVKGPGFSVNGEGQALTPGDEGQCARIRTEGGRIVCGQPVSERCVELLL